MINSEEIRAFYHRISLPEEGIDAFCSGFAALNEKGLADGFDWAAKTVCATRKDYDMYIDMFAKLAGLDRRMVSTMLFTRCFMMMKKDYDERNIPGFIYEDTIQDIRAKILECYKCFGVWGDVVTGWFARFLELTRFGIGRFQYEYGSYNGPMLRFDNVKGQSYVFHQGDATINMHIPSTGISLTDEVRYDSYRKAWEFYKYRFTGEVVAFACGSWLLYAGHDEFLPPHLNILKFLHDFHLVDSHDHYDGFHECPRIFYLPNGTPVDKFPTDTSLQRAYVERLKAGKPTGTGYGIFLFDGEKIYNQPVVIADK